MNNEVCFQPLILAEKLMVQRLSASFIVAHAYPKPSNRFDALYPVK